MNVCIHKDLLGSDLYLVSDSDGFRWSSSIPHDYWLCGRSDDYARSIDLLASAAGVDLRIEPSSSYSKMWSSLRECGTMGVPLRHALAGDVFCAHIKQLLAQIHELLCDYHDTYYTREFVTIRQFLQGLERCKIDKKGVYKILDDDSERDGSLRSFLPDQRGFIRKPVYSQISSCSGRLTVTEGPSILTLRKDRRHLIKSSSPTGSIVQVDFVSLEPRVALSVAGRESQGDIYEMVRQDVLGGIASRNVAKVATIGSLYGMSSRKLSEILGDISASEAVKILKTIRDYFRISGLEKRLKLEASKGGSIKSHYGRAMNVEDVSGHVLVNRFVQSTAADAAILGFSNLVNNIRERGIDIKPIFVIHDALILDIEKRDLDQFFEIASKNIILPRLIGSFPVSSEIIS